VANVEWRFTLIDVGAMELIILPMTFKIALFVGRYGKSRNAAYNPTWSHSLGLDLLMWGIPFLTFIFLGYYSCKSVLLVMLVQVLRLGFTAPVAAQCREKRLPHPYSSAFFLTIGLTVWMFQRLDTLIMTSGANIMPETNMQPTLLQLTCRQA